MPKLDLFDIEVDSVGFVDVGDNQTASGTSLTRIEIMKRAPVAKAPGQTEVKKMAEDKDKGGEKDPIKLLSTLLESKAITAEQHAALVAALSSKPADAPAPPAAFGPEEMAKAAAANPVVAELLRQKIEMEKRATESDKRVAEVAKALADAQEQREKVELAKRVGDGFKHLPESAEAVAAVLHDIRKSITHATDKLVIAKSAAGQPDPFERLISIMKAQDAAIDTAALFGARGTTKHDASGGASVDLTDRSVPVSKRIEAATQIEIAKSAKADASKPLDVVTAQRRVLAENPQLAAEYLMLQ